MNHGMEDYIFAQHQNINGYDLGLYAIFDGHSGHDVAKYLQSHLFENILSEPDFWKNPVHAVKRACKATDDEILEKIADSRGGSTAVAAILINGVRLLVANVGDSRAISCNDGLAKQITVDHEPEKEKDLVESRGGFVSGKPGNDEPQFINICKYKTSLFTEQYFVHPRKESNLLVTEKFHFESHLLAVETCFLLLNSEA